MIQSLQNQNEYLGNNNQNLDMENLNSMMKNLNLENYGNNFFPMNNNSNQVQNDVLGNEENPLNNPNLGNINFDIANVFDMKIDIGEIEEDEESKKENILGNKDYIECIYGLNQREFKEKFNFIFSKKINKNINRNYTSSHSLNLFKSNTRNSMRRDIRVIMFINRQMKKLKNHKNI